MLKTATRAAIALAAIISTGCGGASSESGEKTGEVKTTAGDALGALTPTDMIMGSKDAPVTIIEFASVTCPHCATFHSEILPGIKEKYIDTGKAKLVFREFPTPPPMLSVAGSLVARCAAEKGGADAYFLVVATLMKTQQSWVVGDDPKLELQKVAAQTGMDPQAFEACLKRQDLLDQINARVNEADSKFNVDSTPTFFINGERLPSASINGDGFSRRIDEALVEAAG